MPEWLEQIVFERRSKGIILDTNVLLLMLCGWADPGSIATFKRTADRGYTADDFGRLHRIAAKFSMILVTPHILAELTNLLPQSRDALSQKLAKALVPLVRTLKENHVPKDTLELDPLLPRIGFADLGMIETARKTGCLVVTDDFVASGQLAKAGCAVVNLNILRGQQWLSQ